MMAGVGTHSWFGDSNVEKASSYSASFVRSLKEKLPGNRISYSNHATGGTTTAGSLPQLPLLVDGAGTEMEPDLILIDYSTNDRFERQDWTDNRRNWKFSVADNFGPVFAAVSVQASHVFPPSIGGTCSHQFYGRTDEMIGRINQPTNPAHHHADRGAASLPLARAPSHGRRDR